MARIFDTYLRQRITRRRMLQASGATAAGAGAIALAGYGGDGRNADAAGRAVAGGEVTLDGVLHTAHGQVLRDMNLFGGAALAPNLAFGFTIFDHLFYVPLDTQVVQLMLATTVEQVDPEGLEYRITIGESFFHDVPPVNGRPVLASDIKASYEAYAADNLAPGLGWHHDILESIEAPDDHTLIIKQNQPYAWFFHPGGAGNVASSNILPVETLDDSFDLSRQLIGSGRQMLTENRAGEFLRFQRHPNWRVAGEPFLAGITSSLIGELVQAQATFRAGNIDIVGLANRLEADDLASRMGDAVIITEGLSRSYHTLMLQLDRVPAFQDPRNRRAINKAINREQLIQGVEFNADGGAPAGPIPPAQAAYALSDDEMEEYFRHDPDEARALFQETDFDLDRTYNLVFATDGSGAQQRRAQLLKGQFEAVGMRVTLEEQDLLTQWLPRTLPNGDFDMTSYTQLPYDDPHFPMSFYTTHSPLGDATDPRGRNNMAYFNEGLTTAIDDAEMDLDEASRIAKIKDVVRMMIDDEAPMINLYSSVEFGARRTWYKGTLPASRGAFAGFNGRRWIDTNLRGMDPRMMGDVNCNGEVNAIDAALILQREADLVPFLPCEENADVSGDGRINSVDAALILQREAGLLP